jgi:archaellum component FlaG (FlaF/FlaG flagellin family)
MKAAFAAAALLLAAACSEASGPAAAARVRTDASVYTLPGGGPAPSPGATVSFTVRNTGAFTIVLPNCGAGVATEVQRREAAGWVTFTASVCPALAIYAPVVLAPGEVALGHIAVDEGGRYRLRVPVAEEEGAEFSTYALSPEFEVRSLEN